MPGPIRPWNGAPPSTEDPILNGFLTWVMATLNATQGPLFPPSSPQVTTIPQPGAVQVCWNEVSSAHSYAIFETSNQSPPSGLPLTTVPANVGGNSNSFLRSGLNDTTTRFYWVQAINSDAGQRSQLSQPTSGAALSTGATITPLSQHPVNQSGVGGGVGGGGGIIGIKTNRFIPGGR